MVYNREINDNAKIQCIILYTMSAADRPLRYDDLINLIFENCNVNYVEFQIALAHLEEINHITKLHDDHSCDVFILEAPGKEAIKYLEDTIPAPEMRGWNLYVLKKRGVFRNTLSRKRRRDDGSWEVSDISLSDADIAEIDARLAYALGGISNNQ